MKYILGTAVLSLAATSVLARCPNDCSGKGECNPSSICECWHGYAGNDCSQRVCHFTKAYTDTPLGDINSNEALDVTQQVHLHFSNSPRGEQYDTKYGLARSSLSEEWNEAHFYRECANKGLCNRKTGQCDCFPGFEGEGCQRLSCPSDCSGHGQCVLLNYDQFDYDAWDSDVTQYCECDAGYSGPDCSMRNCDADVDPEESKYTDTSTLFKIEFSMQGDKGNANSIDFFDGTTMLPNGAVLFTVTLQDDYGDEYTTPASTVWYQADCSRDSSEFQPDTSTTSSFCNSVAFPVDPYLHDENEIRSVRSALNLQRLFSNSSLLYESSFVGEHLNNSLNALPSSAARGSLVFTTANTAFDEDSASYPFIYPAYNAPDFAALGSADTSQDATVCNFDESLQNGMCNTDIDYSIGPTQFLNDPKFRFPIFFETNSDIAGAGFTDAARRYLNCDKGSVCIFIRLDGPLNSRALTVHYKYKADIYVGNRTASGDIPDPVSIDGAASPEDFQVFAGPEMTGWSMYAGNSTGAGGGSSASSTGSIVQVSEIGSTREWNTDLDGTPVVTYDSGMLTHTCSKRGICDYESGTCNCFTGYHGPTCSIRM